MSNINSISVSLSKSSLSVGERCTACVQVSPANAEYSVDWRSGNPDVISVSPLGVVYANCPGTTGVHAYVTDVCGNELHAYASITVTGSCSGTDTGTETTTIPVESVTVCPTSVEIPRAGSAYLTATVYPENATDKEIIWYSDNCCVADVNPDSGLVIANAVGSATIYAISHEKHSIRAACTVTVTAPVLVESIEVTSSAGSVASLEQIQLTATVSPGNATFKNVRWTSENPEIASVDNSGVVTGHATGKAKIVATARDGSKVTGSFEIIVLQLSFIPGMEKGITIVAPYVVADPVDIYTGAHMLKNTVMKLFGGQGLKLTAHYNSTHLSCGSMGSGWYHNFEKYVDVEGSQARVYNSPSTYSVYEKDENNSSKFYCTNVLKAGYVLTVASTQQYPYVIDCNKERTEYYNADGLLAKIADHQGFETQITYTDTLITIKDCVTGKSMYLEKNADERITRVYDDTGRQATFTYSDGHLRSICDVDGNSLTFTYNENGQILTGTDEKGVCYFENTYDAYGRVCEQKDGIYGSRKTIFRYEGNERIVTDRNGNTSTRVFDDDGLLTDYTDENGNTIHYEYDENNNVVCERDGAGNYMGKAYECENRPTEITDKNGNTTYLTYDNAGNVIKIRHPDVDGEVCEETFKYNARNQIIEHTDLRGTTTVYTYDANGMPKSKKVGSKPAEQYTYENGLLKSVQDPRGNTTTFTYNARGLLTARTDADGKTTSYAYNKSGDLIETTDANGKKITTAYDCNHQKTSVTDANGNKTEYSYNGNMKNTVVTLPDGGKLRYEYDGEDRPIKITDQADNVTTMQYDKGGRLTTKRFPDNNTVKYEYDGAGRVTKETNPKSAETIKTYDGMGNVLTVKDSAGNITTYEYNAMGKVTRIANAAAGTTLYTYSKAGDLLTETDAFGKTKTYTYDAYGNRLTATDAKGNTTTYAYDEVGNLLTVTDALNHTTTYTYDKLNQLTTVKDAKGNTVTYGYDALGRRTTITDARGNEFKTEYDGNGNVTKTVDAKGNTVSETVYNSLNLPASVIDAAGKTTTYTYNALGKVATVTDGMNHTSTYTYDSRGRNTKVTDAANGESTATYDSLGNVTRLAGPLGGATTYTYDIMGRLKTESTVSGGSVTYTYNALNLKAKLTNARGQERTYSYDAMGRITGYVAPEGTVSYTYDDNSNVLTVTDGNGTITRTYDALNRVISLTDTYGKTIGYEYDEVGNLTKLTYPDNTFVTYAYDANRNLTTVTDWANRVTSYTYDENNRVVGVTKPDGSVTTTTYDNKQRVISTVERTSSGSVITGFEYTYDALSRIVEEKHLANPVKLCYTYDNLNRVTKRTVKNLSDVVLSEENYSYDAAGNLTAAPDSTFSYDTNNRLTWYNGDAVSYDADGNMLSAVLNGTASTTFTYDSGNRLIFAGGHTYTYNAEDVRVRNLCAGEDTKYTYNTNCKLSKLLWKDTNGTVTKYVYGRGLIGEETGSSFTTYHFDCRGSTVALTNASGVITDTFQYDTYGKLISRTGTSNVIFGYNGRDGVVTDTNGLVYMRARYYSPDMRRFVNADIIRGRISDSTSLNRYAYVNGNPVSFIDPFGLEAQRGGESNSLLSTTKNGDGDVFNIQDLFNVGLDGSLFLIDTPDFKLYFIAKSEQGGPIEINSIEIDSVTWIKAIISGDFIEVLRGLERQLFKAGLIDKTEQLDVNITRNVTSDIVFDYIDARIYLVTELTWTYTQEGVEFSTGWGSEVTLYRLNRSKNNSDDKDGGGSLPSLKRNEPSEEKRSGISSIFGEEYIANGGVSDFFTDEHNIFAVQGYHYDSVISNMPFDVKAQSIASAWVGFGVAITKLFWDVCFEQY